MTLRGAIAVLADAALLCAALQAARSYGIAIDVRRSGSVAFLCAAAVLQGVVFVMSGGAPAPVVACGAAGICALTDARSGYVFDAVTYPAICLELAAAILSGNGAQACAGVAVCAGVLAALYLLTRGRGLGLGDVKLAGCIGAGLGAAASWRALEAAFAIGGAWSAYLLLAGRARRGHAIAFAPFLFYGTAIAVQTGVR